MRQFLPFCCALLGVSCLQPARAQSILAGQHPATATYVDLLPDKVLTAQRPGTNTVTDLLDLDADGRADLSLNAYVSTASFPSEAEARLAPLHDDIAIYSNEQTPQIVRFAAQDVIQQNLPQPNPLLPQVWVSRSTIYPYGSSWLTRVGNNPAGNQSFGAWIDGQDGYLGVRLRSGNGWRYGWLRLQVTTQNTSGVIITVKDYALSNIVALQAESAARLHGWQVYPVPAASQLTVQAPAATTGRLQLCDALGRVLLTAPLAPGSTRQQLDLSGLATGVYGLRIETAAGFFFQRLVKQ